MENNIKCKYIFNDDYNPTYVNGAQGGINPLGEIVIHFFLERNALPNSQTFQNENGIPGKEIKNMAEPDDLRLSFVRVIETGVIMSYPVAKEIHRWLGENIEKLEKEVINKQ